MKKSDLGESHLPYTSMNKIITTILLAIATAVNVCGQTDTARAVATEDTVFYNHTLRNVTVKARQSDRSRRLVAKTEIIGTGELIRAACCNLGETFTTNPSVDVSYSDAATGARQIKLLGLSGTYVQMLTENMPNLRGASLPYSLGYVPGPWIQSIQVSKGASSVKNGYESITGQINIGIKKINTSLTQQTVTIIYQKDKATYDDFVKAFQGIGYEIKEVK